MRSARSSSVAAVATQATVTTIQWIHGRRASRRRTATDILDSGQIVTDRFSLPLPEDLPPGDYRVRIGVYSAESGQRLPVTATGALSAELIGPDYVMLPVVLRVVAP